MIPAGRCSTIGLMVPAAPEQPRHRIAVVVSRYTATVTDRLLQGALAEAKRRGGWVVDVWHAPGSFELPALADRALATQRYDGVVTLGCIIRGETTHDQHIAAAVAQGVVDVSLKHGCPVTLGVLTVNTAEQASERAGGRHGNKGADAMGALLDVLAVMGQAQSGPAAANPSPQTFAISSTINDKASGSV
jgi:6,7-dimethyl-8-ribityllumazine synthase